MTEILLSICIPTYNRPEKLYSLVKNIISYQSDKIEVIIGDDNPSSTRTQNVIKEFSDKRIRYFHNKKNIGLELNLIKIFKLARGKFVSYIADDDHVEVKTLPWLLEKISEKSNITQFCNTIGDKRPGKKKNYYEFGEGLLRRGLESILKLLFYYGHASGIVLRKDVLDLDKTIKYCKTYTLCHYLVAQTMLAGDTLCSNKIFVYKGLDESERPVLFKDKKWWHPLSGLIITKYRIKIINEILKGKLKRFFLMKKKQNIYNYLHRSLSYNTKNYFDSFKNLLEGIGIIITIREISKSPVFWINLIIEFFLNFLKSSNIFFKIFRYIKKYCIKKH